MSTNRALSVYGNRQELEQFADRIRELLPGGSKLTPQQALSLAQVSSLYGLSPFNGEVWYIPGVGVMIGIKGLRKKAHEQLGETCNFWTTFREIVNPEERKRHLIPDASLAFECRLFDTQTIITYSDTIKIMRAAEVPIADIMRIVGDQPYTVGIGVFKTGEQTRMLPLQCAMKRAEADAIKRRFDVPFNVSDDELPMATNGEIIDASTGEIVSGNGHGDGQAATDELFGEEQKPAAIKQEQRPWAAETVREKAATYVTAHAASYGVHNAKEGELKAAMASLSGLLHGDDGKRKAVLRYLFSVESGKELTTGQCKALQQWIGAKPNADGEWIPNANAITEAERIITADAVERGQTTMPLAEPVTAGK